MLVVYDDDRIGHQFFQLFRHTFRGRVLHFGIRGVSGAEKPVDELDDGRCRQMYQVFEHQIEQLSCFPF